MAVQFQKRKLSKVNPLFFTFLCYNYDDRVIRVDDVVISPVFDMGIQTYLDYRFKPESPEFNSFFVVVIRLLCIIYGESCIIIPYQSKVSNDLDINLVKYGFEMDKIIDFKEQLSKSYSSYQEKKVILYFENIQKILIDMLMKKKDLENISMDKITSFYDLLYTPRNKNSIQLSDLFINAVDRWEIDKYFREELTKHQRYNTPKKKRILNPDVYDIFGITMEQVNDMTAEYLEFINHQIFLSFGISDYAINKEYILEKRLEEFKRNNKITSGNGYVDILLVLSVVLTIGLMISIMVMIIKV